MVVDTVMVADGIPLFLPSNGLPQLVATSTQSLAYSRVVATTLAPDPAPWARVAVDPQQAATLVGLPGVGLTLENADVTAVLYGVLTAPEAIVSLVERVARVASDPMRVRAGV